MIGSATFSSCEKYRYTLSRDWSDSDDKKRILFIMLNPSTADANKFDPTVKRCYTYAVKWGYNVMDVGNIYAYRATDPKDMLNAQKNGIDIVGQDNDVSIQTMCDKADRIVCAWGSHGWSKHRAIAIKNVLKCWYQHKTSCLKKCKDGSPSHPLYLKGDLLPIEFL